MSSCNKWGSSSQSKRRTRTVRASKRMPPPRTMPPIQVASFLSLRSIGTNIICYVNSLPPLLFFIKTNSWCKNSCVLLFSHCLDLVESSLLRRFFPAALTLRVDGSMSPQQRFEAARLACLVCSSRHCAFITHTTSLSSIMRQQDGGRELGEIPC